MTKNEINPGKSCFGWIAKVFVGLITLVSAVVGILEYLNPLHRRRHLHPIR